MSNMQLIPIFKIF